MSRLQLVISTVDNGCAYISFGDSALNTGNRVVLAPAGYLYQRPKGGAPDSDFFHDCGMVQVFSVCQTFGAPEN